MTHWRPPEAPAAQDPPGGGNLDLSEITLGSAELVDGSTPMNTLISDIGSLGSQHCDGCSQPLAPGLAAAGAQLRAVQSQR